MKPEATRIEGQDEELDKILSAIREVITNSSPNTDVLELTDKVEDEPFNTLSTKPSFASKPNSPEVKKPANTRDSKTANIVIDMLADLERKKYAANDDILNPEVIKQSKKLLQEVIKNNHQAEPSNKISINITLEDMVTEVLKPYLSEWLNKNLPSIVSGIVQNEIKKIIP